MEKKKIIKNDLSVREVESIVRELKIGDRRAKKKRPPSEEDVQIKMIEDNLMHILGTRVKLQHGPQGGKIEIRYFSQDDLERILDLLMLSEEI